MTCAARQTEAEFSAVFETLLTGLRIATNLQAKPPGAIAANARRNSYRVMAEALEAAECVLMAQLATIAAGQSILERVGLSRD